MATFFTSFFVLAIALIGACAGSFLNVVIWRIPEKMSLVSPPSHCPKCGAPVRWYDNVPVLSWFYLRGKCRDCRAPISFRYPAVEALSGLGALLAAIAVLVGGWSGARSQCFHWDEYSRFITENRANLFEVDQIDPADPVSQAMDVYLTDSFVALTVRATSLCLLMLLLTDSFLMLGFIEYDRGRSPASISVAGWAILLCGACLTAYLRLDSEPGDGMQSAQIFAASAGTGALGAAFAGWLARGKKGEVFELATLGALWGFWAGYKFAFVGAFLLVLVGSLLRCRTSRNYTGILFFSAFMLHLAMNAAFSLAS